MVSRHGWNAPRHSAIDGSKPDRCSIPIDRSSGFSCCHRLCYWAVHKGGRDAAAKAIVLFRYFDITKIFPIAKLEKLAGGAGIVLDDVMAGVYTFVVLRLLIAWGIL